MPDLIQKQKTREKQEVKVYVGYEGVKTFYNEILEKLDKGDEYLAITFHDESLDNSALEIFFSNFHTRRAKAKIKAKILVNDKDKLAMKNLDFTKTGLYEFKKTTQSLPAGHCIFGDTVAFFNWGSTPRVFVMICEENAIQYRNFFYDMWKKAKII